MKKTICTLALILWFGAGAAYADNPIGRWASPSDPDAKSITALEDMWAHTACSSVPAELKAAFAKDFQGTSPNGERYGRPTSWGGEGDDTACQLQKIQIRLFGDSVAVAYGNESSVSRKKEGIAEKQCLAWTDTWLKRGGKWRVVAAQGAWVICE